eukprot:scpid47647/ scgid16081/ 
MAALADEQMQPLDQSCTVRSMPAGTGMVPREVHYATWRCAEHDNYTVAITATAEQQSRRDSVQVWFTVCYMPHAHMHTCILIVIITFSFLKGFPKGSAYRLKCILT